MHLTLVAPHSKKPLQPRRISLSPHVQTTIKTVKFNRNIFWCYASYSKGCFVIKNWFFIHPDRFLRDSHYPVFRSALERPWHVKGKNTLAKDILGKLLRCLRLLRLFLARPSWHIHYQLYLTLARTPRTHSLRLTIRSRLAPHRGIIQHLVSSETMLRKHQLSLYVCLMTLIRYPIQVTKFPSYHPRRKYILRLLYKMCWTIIGRPTWK